MVRIHDDTDIRQKCQQQCRLRLHGKQFFVSTLVYTFSVPVEVYLPSTRFSVGHFIAMNRRAAAAIVAICVSIKMRRRKKRSVWVKDWIKRRAQLGAYNQLLSELKNEDPECYKNFLRMKHDDFQYLCDKISPAIKKQDTNMRLAISVEERLAITLRFLASGKYSLSYFYTIKYLLPHF